MVFPFLFLVGTNVGDISLWEVGSRERLAHKPFKVWDISVASMPLQVLNQFPVGINYPFIFVIDLSKFSFVAMG